MLRDGGETRRLQMENVGGVLLPRHRRLQQRQINGGIGRRRIGKGARRRLRTVQEQSWSKEKRDGRMMNRAGKERKRPSAAALPRQKLQPQLLLRLSVRNAKLRMQPLRRPSEESARLLNSRCNERPRRQRLAVWRPRRQRS
jgi:hypothetical protein